MGLNDCKGDFTPFAMTEKPVKQHPLLLPLLWGVSWLLTAKDGLTIERVGMKGIRPPFLVLATHQGPSDYFLAPLALFPHRANYVSDIEGFANYGKTLYRYGGCIGKRRYVPDISVMNNIRYALFTLRQPVVLFPESRHCDAGITSVLPDDLGRLAKVLGVPVMLLTMHGSYLKNPFWDEAHARKVPLRARLELLYTEEQVRTLSPAVMQAEIEQRLQYDEYAYQRENSIRIGGAHRAEGLHLPLYRCRNCHTKGSMDSKGTFLFCRACGERWQLQENGQLLTADGCAVDIPDWYRWERAETRAEIAAGHYGLRVRVRIEALPNEKGFIPMGDGMLTHDRSGFTLTPDSVPAGAVDTFPLHIPSRLLASAQTEYNYRGKGACLVLSTQNCCYYLYSDDKNFHVTELEFAAELLFGYVSGTLSNL